MQTIAVGAELKGFRHAGLIAERDYKMVFLGQHDAVARAVETGKAPGAIVEERGMKQVTDTGAIEAAVDAIIAANPDKVEQAKAKPTMLGWFVGQVMKQTGGKANPQAVNDLLKQKLGI